MLNNFDFSEFLFQFYTVIGFFVISLLIIVFKYITKKTKNTVDDKIVEKVEKWHAVVKDKIKK